MEAPDKLFLLVGEEEIKLHLKRQTGISLVFWLFVQTLFLLLFAPLFLAMGYGLPVFLIYVLLFGLGKYFLFRQKASKFFTETGLDWDYVISQEASVSKSCFVSLPSLRRSRGISNSVKRRAYLDFILKAVQKVPGKIWQNLYLRSYLRNGDLFALSLRLLLLSILAQVFIEQAWIANSSGGSL